MKPTIGGLPGGTYFWYHAKLMLSPSHLKVISFLFLVSIICNIAFQNPTTMYVEIIGWSLLRGELYNTDNLVVCMCSYQISEYILDVECRRMYRINLAFPYFPKLQTLDDDIVVRCDIH